MEGSRNHTLHDRLETGEQNVHTALVSESPMSEADSTSGRQIYNTLRDSRRRNFAGLLTVALCALVAFYAGRVSSSSGRIDSRTKMAIDAPVSMEEVKDSNGTIEKDKLKSAEAKIMELKKKLEKAQDKVKLSESTTVKADDTKAAPTTAAVQEERTTAQKATTAEQKVAQQKDTSAPTTAAVQKERTTAQKAIMAEQKGAQQKDTSTQKTTTVAQKATTAPKQKTTTKTASEKQKTTKIAKDEGEDKKNHTNNGKPVVPDPSFGWPTEVYWPRLFCFSVMNKDNQQEIATMKMQVKMHIGIASCERFAILSGARIYLGDGHKWDNGTAVKVHSWLNPAKAVPMGNLQAGDETNSFKNTDIFINAWNILIGSKIMQGDIDWIIKADPDAVFFPERLRKHVKPFSWGEQTKTPMYFKNCNYKGPKLYGALEVFNQAAMLKLSKHMSWCTGLPWGGWGEDEFIDKCMVRLSARALEDYKLVGDHRCMSAECEATDRASFHDYKSPELYKNCWTRSKNSEKWVKKMAEGNFFCCTSPGNPGDPCNTCNPGASTKPNQGWCGSSKNQCKGCGNGAAWCKFDKKKKRNVVSDS